LEACPRFWSAEVRHRADELVAAVAHDHVVGADIGAEGLAEELQQRVAGQMALTVVDLFEAVNVDEREHERGARAMCTLELARHLLKAELARPCARQLVRRRELQVVCRFGAVAERLSAFTGCRFPVGGRPRTVVGCFGPIGRRPRPIALGPQQNVLPTRVRVLLQIVQTSQRITTLRATITKRGSPITILRRSQPRRRTLVAQDRHRGPVATRPLPRQRGPVISDRVATGREIIVSGVLILIRASLITPTPRLIVIRPRLVLITPRLVLLRPPLVVIAREAITDATSRTTKEFGATRRTTRNPGHLAAGRTSHNPRHRLAPSPRASLLGREL